MYIFAHHPEFLCAAKILFAERQNPGLIHYKLSGSNAQFNSCMEDALDLNSLDSFEYFSLFNMKSCHGGGGETLYMLDNWVRTV